MCATWRINHPDYYKPPITDLDGVKAMGEEVRQKGFTALKTNTFDYDANGKPTGYRPGFGIPFEPGLNIERKQLRDLRTHLEAMRDGAGPDVIDFLTVADGAHCPALEVWGNDAQIVFESDISGSSWLFHITGTATGLGSMQDMMSGANSREADMAIGDGELIPRQPEYLKFG